MAALMYNYGGIKKAAIALVKSLDSGEDHTETLAALKQALRVTVQVSKDQQWLQWDGASEFPLTRIRVVIRRRDGCVKRGQAHEYNWNWKNQGKLKPTDVMEYFLVKEK